MATVLGESDTDGQGSNDNLFVPGSLSFGRYEE